MKKLTFSLLVLMGFQGFSQENLTYQKPSVEILQLADFQRTPSVSMNSKKDWMLFSYRPTYKSLEDLNQQEMKLAGLRVNPVTNISSTTTYINNLKIRKINEKTETQVSGLPQNPRISNISWSPNEKKIAFTHTTEKGVELWILDTETRAAKKLTADHLNANLGMPFTWYRNSESLLVRVLPKNRPILLDEKKNLPTGPIVSNSDGKVSQNRTFQDLLKNPMDETNFETLTKSELYRLDLKGNATKIMAEDIYSGTVFSPDGNYLMVSTIKKPFSYIVPLNRFPQTTKVYDLKGNLVKTVNEIPLNEIQPKGFSSVRTGKRNMSWRADQPSTLFYVEALDGGDQENKAEYRDEMFLWEAPFKTNPKSLGKVKQRFAGMQWGNAQNAIAMDSWYDTRSVKTYHINPQTSAIKEISDRNFQDVYSDPGNFQVEKNEWGQYVIAIKEGKTYLLGDGFTKEGQFPFIDELNLNTMEKKRLYTSKIEGVKEDFVDILDSQKGDVLVTQQSKNQYPNYYIRNFKTLASAPITQFKNPFESISNIHKEVIKYKRNDGVELKGTLYLPANYDFAKKLKLPMLVWAYPEEFKDKATAGQNTANPNEFTFPSYGSFIYWVTKGYAVLDDASFPIIGEGKTEPNDSFIPQLVANGKAAIDAVDQLGYIDRNRVAVGGTLMVHL